MAETGQSGPGLAGVPAPMGATPASPADPWRRGRAGTSLPPRLADREQRSGRIGRLGGAERRIEPRMNADAGRRADGGADGERTPDPGRPSVGPRMPRPVGASGKRSRWPTAPGRRCPGSLRRAAIGPDPPDDPRSLLGLRSLPVRAISRRPPRERLHLLDRTLGPHML